MRGVRRAGVAGSSANASAAAQPASLYAQLEVPVLIYVTAAVDYSAGTITPSLVDDRVLIGQSVAVPVSVFEGAALAFLHAAV